MPRVKALTTGSVPSFLDLILNFAESDTSSSLATQDTWLAQLRARPNSKLVFYGDDTWLKLFPGDFFARHDGTSSFFVSDFTEVDNNVTRNIPQELERDDWNVMIMHYLGLDHIGHKTGPQGPNMLPKQKEMDGIVKIIYQALEEHEHHERTLLVVAGDHGMNAGGNHGGSGPGETEPALLFASPKLREFQKKSYECPTLPREGTEFHFYTKMEQSDVVPTLAALLGFPIPRNSLGVCMEEILGFANDADKKALLRQNIRQLLHIVEVAVGQDYFKTAIEEYRSTDATTMPQACDEIDAWEKELACRFAAIESKKDAYISETELYQVLYLIQDNMSSTASSYNIPRMIVGTLIASLSATFGVFSLKSLWPPTGTGIAFVLTTVLYGVMMFASSYVEEEQHFWYWMTPIWIASLGVRRLSQHFKSQTATNTLRTIIKCIVVIALHRLCIRWNQTGQKYAGAPDIVHTVFPEHYHFMWLLILATYLLIGYRITFTSLIDIVSAEAAPALAVAMIVAAIIFKLNFTQADAPELVGDLALRLREYTKPWSLVLQARTVFAFIGSAMVAISASVSRKASLAKRAGEVLTGLLTRLPSRTSEQPRNKTTQAMSSIDLFSSVDVAALALLLSHTTFFCFGGSNSISSLDLSNAYNGVAGYNIGAVGVLLLASNWTGPIWWSFFAVSKLLPALATTSADRQVAAESKHRSWVEQERKKLHTDAVHSVKVQQKPQQVIPSGETWSSYMAALTIFFAASLVAVMAACTALRTHLFIWTVFSPKYLYSMAWSAGWHLLINGWIGGLVHLLAGRTSTTV
ncbi:hypothetical protein MRB53_038838 [Persea americana]|nr:hypothetical protein MRB53_038838 [Persea americana]